MASEKRLIVSADEFGRSRGANRGVIEAHRLGIVTSAALVVTGSGASEAAALAGENPQLGVGLLVTLTGGAPLSSAVDVPSLVSARGLLPEQATALSGASPDEILVEVRAQYRRFRELLRRLPTHLAARADAHALRPVFEALVTLAWETGLPVRGTSAAMRSRLRQEDVRTTDEFVDQEIGERAAVTTLLGMLRKLGDGTTELRSQPARSEEGASGERAAAGECALAALTDAEVGSLVRELGIRLTHFGQL
jgi:predicted glycoside hydrolase/deacetylase ChbG (UPF0249 family)